ncbi:MAG: peptide MFS transporter [Bacteroidota bacterium]|nr:peptide MFS transporter [Bacteroidota bacterium]MDP4244746.1 peptide MFS transporter [Bacteroidota bacterium]MDP4252394.1 peptide MFS transporter [Bacteroidota bacterium]
MNEPIKAGRHPKALYVLFLTEMWERFAYYLIAGILLIYLIDNKGGKGMDEKTAADIAGSFFALIWLPLFIGGYIADRYLGYIRSIFLGGCLLAAGYFGLALPGNTAMYVSLGLIVVGNGFFKPNISTLLGNIYNREDLKPLKNNAYNIFYMGINIGSLLCNFAAAYLRNKYGWGAAFSAAGAGIVIGLITLGANLKKIRVGDVRKEPQKEDMPLSKILAYVFLPGFLAAVVGYFLPSKVFHTTIMGSPSSDAFVFACVPVVSFFISIWVRARGQDKRGIGALLFIFSISVIFWAIFYQNFTAYTLWAEKHTDRTISWSVTEKLADNMHLLQKVNTQPREVTQVDSNLVEMKDSAGNMLKTVGPDPYFNNVPKANWPPPGVDLKLSNSELYQSIGPLFIVTLTPLLVLLFSWLRKRGKEPTTASKFGIALFLSAMSSLVMVFAVLSVASIYHYKVSSLWLWGTYLMITLAEIFLSPMGLSLTSKLAPARLTSLMMGGWFLTMSLGSKVAGLMTSSWNKFPDKKIYFLVWIVAAVIGGVLIFSRVKSLNRILVEKTGTT